jgi:hypothetical protein
VPKLVDFGRDFRVGSWIFVRRLPASTVRHGTASSGGSRGGGCGVCGGGGEGDCGGGTSAMGSPMCDSEAARVFHSSFLPLLALGRI